MRYVLIFLAGFWLAKLDSKYGADFGYRAGATTRSRCSDDASRIATTGRRNAVFETDPHRNGFKNCNDPVNPVAYRQGMPFPEEPYWDDMADQLATILRAMPDFDLSLDGQAAFDAFIRTQPRNPTGAIDPDDFSKIQYVYTQLAGNGIKHFLGVLDTLKRRRRRIISS